MVRPQLMEDWILCSRTYSRSIFCSSPSVFHTCTLSLSQSRRKKKHPRISQLFIVQITFPSIQIHRRCSSDIRCLLFFFSPDCDGACHVLNAKLGGHSGNGRYISPFCLLTSSGRLLCTARLLHRLIQEQLCGRRRLSSLCRLNLWFLYSTSSETAFRSVTQFIATMEKKRTSIQHNVVVSAVLKLQTSLPSLLNSIDCLRA